MKGKLTAYVAIAMAFVFLTPDIAQSKSVENYKWIEVRSENFVIRSLLSTRQTVKVARQLEMTRAVIPESILRLRGESSDPEYIYLLKGPNQLNEVGHKGDTWAHMDLQNGKYILVGSDVYAQDRLPRLYAEFLVLTEPMKRHSMWYGWGMYTYFRNARISDGRFRYGGQRSNQRKNPNVILPQVELVLSEDEVLDLSNDRRAKVGGYSWFLIRYLTNTNKDWLAFGSRLTQYNERIEEGEDIREAFESAFEVSIDSLGDAMADFSETCCGEYVVAVDELLPEFDPDVSKLSREQISLGLGVVAADLGATDRALELYALALGSDATRAAAQAGIDVIQSNNRE